MDLNCAVEVLGRVPEGPHDMTPNEIMKVAQRCMSGPFTRGDQERMGREFPALKPIEIEKFDFLAYPLLPAVFEKTVSSKSRANGFVRDDAFA